MLKIGLWFVCFISASFAFAAQPEGLVKVEAEWNMSLDANGAITALDAKPGQMKDPLRKILETAVRGWEFEPGSVNSKPAATETNLSVSISLWPAADGNSYSMKFDGVQTGGGLAKIGNMPTFPPNQVKKSRSKGINYVVVLEISYDENGTPGEIVVADHSPVKHGSLVTEAIRAVRTWTFKPERVAGHGIAAHAWLPICYAAVANARKGGNCDYPSDKGDVPFESGAVVPVESQVTLKSDVIGRAL